MVDSISPMDAPFLPEGHPMIAHGLRLQTYQSPRARILALSPVAERGALARFNVPSPRGVGNPSLLPFREVKRRKRRIITHQVSGECLCRIPKGFRNKAQGCEERATLG